MHFSQSWTLYFKHCLEEHAPGPQALFPQTQKPCYGPEKSKQRVAHSDFCILKFMKTCLVTVGFSSLFSPSTRVFFKNVPQPKFYICSTSVNFLYTHFPQTVYLLNFKTKLLLQNPCLLSGLF